MKSLSSFLTFLLSTIICFYLVAETSSLFSSALDIRYWRCIMKRHRKCPDHEIRFYLYTPDHPYKERIDLRVPGSLQMSSWDPSKKNVIILHGFNGTENKVPMSFIRKAYISRGDYNVFTVDWQSLTVFPCYLSALSNTKLVAQCTAQLYSHITKSGGLAKKTTCVGHSLGAHICGMISNHLSEPQHKIVGLDPAKPLIREYASRHFRLTPDDANVVQVIHTNSGFLGDIGLIGHADFCINGGHTQPGCKGHFMRIARCSHFQSACYFAASVRNNLRAVAVPCDTRCPRRTTAPILNDKPTVRLGDDIPETARGMYCVRIDHDQDCPFD